MKVSGAGVPPAGKASFRWLWLGRRGRSGRDWAGTPVGRAVLPLPLGLSLRGLAAAAVPLPRDIRAGGRLTEESRRPSLTQQPGRAWSLRLRRAPVPVSPHRSSQVTAFEGAAGPRTGRSRPRGGAGGLYPLGRRWLVASLCRAVCGGPGSSWRRGRAVAGSLPRALLHGRGCRWVCRSGLRVVRTGDLPVRRVPRGA